MAHDGRVTESQEPRPTGDATTTPGPDVVPTGRPNARLRQTVWDMVRSMALVLGVVAVIFLLAWRPQPEAIKVVDPAPTVELAAVQADFEVVAPTGLSSEWRPTSARWQPTEKSGGAPVLHIGYVTPTDEYAQVSMSASDDAAFLEEQTAGGQQTGTQAVGSQTWQRWETAKRRSLVLVAQGRTLSVSGTGSWDELIALAVSLEPVPRP